MEEQAIGNANTFLEDFIFSFVVLANCKIANCKYHQTSRPDTLSISQEMLLLYVSSKMSSQDGMTVAKLVQQLKVWRGAGEQERYIVFEGEMTAFKRRLFQLIDTSMLVVIDKYMGWNVTVLAKIKVNCFLKISS